LEIVHEYEVFLASGKFAVSVGKWQFLAPPTFSTHDSDVVISSYSLQTYV